MGLIAAPRPLKPYARALRFAFKSVSRLFGNHHPRECPVCGYKGRFFSYGFPLVADVLCPNCLSLERHRALALSQRDEAIFSGKDILHFAPEPGMRRLVERASPRTYRTCDLFARNVDLKINVEQIDLPDASFDLVLCLHVLEHVDDRRALAELHRILRPAGLLVLMVPIEEGWDATYENEAIVDRQDRLIHFGQEDHVRYYGRDFTQRVESAGFKVKTWTSCEPDVRRYGLKRGEKVFLAMKI